MLNNPSASASDSTVPGESSGISDDADVDGAVAAAVDADADADADADVTSSVLYLELLDMIAGDAVGVGVAAALGGMAALGGTAIGVGTRLLDVFDVVEEVPLGLRGDAASTGWITPRSVCSSRPSGRGLGLSGCGGRALSFAVRTRRAGSSVPDEPDAVDG